MTDGAAGLRALPQLLTQAGGDVKEEVWRGCIVLLTNTPELHGYAARALLRALREALPGAQLSLVATATWYIGALAFPAASRGCTVRGIRQRCHLASMQEATADEQGLLAQRSPLRLLTLHAEYGWDFCEHPCVLVQHQPRSEGYEPVMQHLAVLFRMLAVAGQRRQARLSRHLLPNA